MTACSYSSCWPLSRQRSHCKAPLSIKDACCFQLNACFLIVAVNCYAPSNHQYWPLSANYDDSLINLKMTSCIQQVRLNQSVNFTTRKNRRTISTWHKVQSRLKRLAFAASSASAIAEGVVITWPLKQRLHLAFKVEQPSSKNSKVAAEVSLLQRVLPSTVGHLCTTWDLIFLRTGPSMKSSLRAASGAVSSSASELLELVDAKESLSFSLSSPPCLLLPLTDEAASSRGVVGATSSSVSTRWSLAAATVLKAASASLPAVSPCWIFIRSNILEVLDSSGLKWSPLIFFNMLQYNCNGRVSISLEYTAIARAPCNSWCPSNVRAGSSKP